MTQRFPEENERTVHIDEQLKKGDEQRAYDDAMADIANDEPDSSEMEYGYQDAEADAWHSQYD